MVPADVSIAFLLAATGAMAASPSASPNRKSRLVFHAVADDDGGLSVVRPTERGRGGFVAKAAYTRDVNGTGWDYLEIQTCHKKDDSTQAYAAGLLEGAITADRINVYWENVFKNFCDNREDLCTRLTDYLQKNKDWVMSQVSMKNGSDSYWHQVGLMYKQLDGLYDGYKSSIKDGMHSLTWENFFWMNIQEDLYDLCDAFNSSHPHKKPFGTGSCSALIKLVPEHNELYFSHVTWNWYETMLRIQKRYRLNYKVSKLSNQRVFGHDITFTSYPGFLYSLDDFYLISSGLAVTETTNTVYNPDLWSNVRPVGQLFVFVRAMVANRLATDGLAWTKLFRQHNSGTYNNQWMVINYSLFLPSRRAPKYGLLHVLEQMPGLIEARDMTKEFLKHTYWASYNVPFFPAMFEISGQASMVKRYGNWFSYNDTPRARIFARDHVGVTDMQSMLQLMRSNDFKHDPESRCESCIPPYSAENAISSRDDLNDINGVYPFGALGHSNWGAIDAKITSHKSFKQLQFLAISGPTMGTGGKLGAYCWSKSHANVSHVGLPDCWNFKPKMHQWIFKTPSPAFLRNKIK